jgi:DNA-binding CsgD family transcriptional regulator
MAGSTLDATAAINMALALGRQGDWSGTVAIGPAYLARALVAARSGAAIDSWNDLANAAEISIRFRAWNLLRATQAVAAMCGQLDRPLPAPDASVEAAGHAPIADKILDAWHAQHALESGDTCAAAAILATATPVELALCPWVEASLAIHGRDRTHTAIGHLPRPASPAARIERLLVDAALADDAARSDLVCEAITEARAAGLEGLLRHYPGTIDHLREAAPSDEHLSTLLADGPRSRTPLTDPNLSERELEILRFLDGPLTINEIGSEVYLSAHTAKWYVSRIYRKLQVHSRSEATSRARSLGLIPPESSTFV